MSYEYSAIIMYKDTSGRFHNLTATPTVSAFNTSGSTISGAAITNLATGIYKVSVSQDNIEDVIFTIIPDLADQSNFADTVVMQERVAFVADDILVDTGTSIPASITSLQSWVATQISETVASSSITQIRGNSWDISISDVTLNSYKQQFVIKNRVSQSDASSTLVVDNIDGLTVLNGQTPSSGSASAVLSYNSSASSLSLVIEDASVTAQLPTGEFFYGIQSITEAGLVYEVYGGTFSILSDIVRNTE